MPSESLPFDRKDFSKERKPSSSDTVGIVPTRWRVPPTTLLQNNNHGSLSSCHLGGGGGASDIRRPISDGSGSDENKCRRNVSSKENDINNNRVSVACSIQKDPQAEASESPNSNTHPHPDFVNSSDQLPAIDQHTNNNGDGANTTGYQRLERENLLGSSLDLKPLKWIHSGSLSSRGSGFNHSSSSKISEVAFLDAKIEAQHNSTPLQLPSGHAAYCVTPRTDDDASSRKKPRLGWGEGLAKYERKNLGPDDIVDTEAGTRFGMVDGGSRSEPLLSRPLNLNDKSPSLASYSECASSTTSCSFACGSSPGLEEKATTLDSDTCSPRAVSCHLSQNYIERLSLNLENLEGLNLSYSLDELLQTDDSSAPGPGFVKSTTAMDKLQVLKAEITKTLEITESEIDSLENELKSSISDVGGSCSFSAASTSFLAGCNKNAEESCGHLLLRNISSGDMPADSLPENRTGVRDLYGESASMEIFEPVEPTALCNNVTCSGAVEQSYPAAKLDIRSEKAKCSVDHVSDDMLGIATSCKDVHYGIEDKLYNSILATNKSLAQKALDEFNKILPTKHLHNNISRGTNQLLIKKKIATRRRFLKFKERLMALKFLAFRYSWKEDLRLLSIRRFGAKSQKKFGLGYTDRQKYGSSLPSRLSSSGSLNLFETKEIVDYLNKLLSDSRVRVYRIALKMPSYILDKRERMTSRFISDNRLVENPIDVEKKRSIVNPWTVEEKEIFLEKYSLFGKNFNKIASFLERKTIADCVEFYYKNHKSDHFRKTKRSVFDKGKSSTAHTYLVSSGRILNRETGATSLEMLGAASAMVANVDDWMPRQRKCTPNLYVGYTSSSCGGDSISQSSIAMFCNEQETSAADVLAGICGARSSEALGSCITSSGDVHHQDSRRCQKLGGTSKRMHLAPEGSYLNDVDEGSWSDDSCGEEMESSDWTDEEQSSFIKAVGIYGKDFSMISQCMRTRSSDQCRVFYSKCRKRLGLDVINLAPGSESNLGGGSEDDHEDACMVHSGSVISHSKSFLDGKTDIEDLHFSDAECDRNVVNGCEVVTKPEVGVVGDMNDNLEGAADSEAVNMKEAIQHTHSQGCAGDMNSPCVSGARVETDTVSKVSSKICREGIRASKHQLPSGNACEVEDLNSSSHHSVDLSTDLQGSVMKLNASEKVIASKEPGNGFLMSKLIPQDHPTSRKTLSQDDASRHSFRKSGDCLSQSASSTVGYHLLLPKHSLLDCVESSKILRGYPVNEPNINYNLDLMDGYLQKCPGLISDSQEEMHSLPEPDVEKPCKCGDVKLFGQILTKCSSQGRRLRESDQSSLEGKTHSFNLMFDNHCAADSRSASLDHDWSNNYSFCVDSNLPPRISYGFWDGNRIQMGFPSLFDSAKHPAAFSNTNIDQHQQLHACLKGGNEHHSNFVSGFYTTKKSSSRGMYGSSTLAEMPLRKESFSVQEEQVINVVSCNRNGGVISDPMAAIRMHYAKTQHYKSGMKYW